ncbi:hypothetical protein PCANC_23208 [Puccinia coronata f. sp. avenae]|uniref:Uncharacterized protein n=1 Tax=Puccinia coronata f. sp. avenae TaxID=200324 RepID=A0A2N5S816_9BASI|nr:hypothetical protein PCANC_23208 [Puccinia coronata f. sp. avenae]
MAAAPPVKLYAFSPATVNHSQTYLVLHPSHHPFFVPASHRAQRAVWLDQLAYDAGERETSEFAKI